MTASFLIIDDHPLISAGLSKLLSEKFENADIEILESLTSGSVTQKLGTVSCPVVIFLNYELEGLDVAAFVTEVQSLSQKAQVVIHNASDDLETAVTMFAAGAMAYITKDVPDTQIVSAVRAVLQDKQWLTPILGAKAAKQLGQPATELLPLKERERAVLFLLAQGLTNKDIAVSLSLAEQTVKNIVSNLYDIFEVENRSQLVLRAQELEAHLWRRSY